MNKSISQKTGGCKAAKLPTAQNSLQLLRNTRDKNEAAAREHALRSALDYYFQGGVPERQQVETLRKLVFGNWLQEHAFSENFKPMNAISR